MNIWTASTQNNDMLNEEGHVDAMGQRGWGPGGIHKNHTKGVQKSFSVSWTQGSKCLAADKRGRHFGFTAACFQKLA